MNFKKILIFITSITLTFAFLCSCNGSPEQLTTENTTAETQYEEPPPEGRTSYLFYSYDELFAALSPENAETSKVQLEKSLWGDRHEQYINNLVANGVMIPRLNGEAFLFGAGNVQQHHVAVMWNEESYDLPTIMFLGLHNDVWLRVRIFDLSVSDADCSSLDPSEILYQLAPYAPNCGKYADNEDDMDVYTMEFQLSDETVTAVVYDEISEGKLHSVMFYYKGKWIRVDDTEETGLILNPEFWAPLSFS